MSQPLREDCTDFEAYQFFKDCKEEIRRIAKQSKLQKTLTKTLAKASQIKQSKASSQTDPMLLTNLITDYLRSLNYNYTYSVFMREANIIPEEIVGKGKVAGLVDVEEELRGQERFDVSVVELMVRKLDRLRDRDSKKVECGSQIDLINSQGVQNNVLLIENRAKEIRQQVEARQKKYYEKLLESMRSKEIMELRLEITKQVEQKYGKEKQRLNKKFQELIEKAKANQNPTKLKQQNDVLLNKNYELTTALTKSKNQSEQLKKQNLKHDCHKSPQFIALTATIKTQRKQLQQKKQELDYALRNINTKVQDLVLQKRKIEGQKKTDAFLEQIKIKRENKDHLIETIHTEMRQMDARVKVLAEENGRLRDNVKELKMGIKEKEEYCKRLEEEQIFRDTDFDKKKTHKEGITYPIPNENQMTINRAPANKCPECKLRKLKNKMEMIDICVGVKQSDLIPPSEPEIANVSQVSESDFDQFEDQKLEHNKRLALIKAQMNMIKKKVLLLVDDTL